MKVEIDLEKSVGENASVYYEKAKKARKKLEGLKEALVKTEKEVKKLEAAKVDEKDDKKVVRKKVKRNKDWYEKCINLV